LRYVLPAAGFFVLAVAGVVIGTVADAHHNSGVSELGADVAGVSLGLVIAMLVRAYIIGVRVPAAGRKPAAMLQAMEARQSVSGHATSPAACTGVRRPSTGSRYAPVMVEGAEAVGRIFGN
jgi:hypothetical protein